MYVRYVDQSAPATQRAMLAAWADARENYEYISPSLSPATVWLTAYQDFVAATAPADVEDDGSVTAAAFYGHLDAFLEAQVHHHARS